MLLWITYGNLQRAHKQTNKAPSVWKRWMIMMNVKKMKGMQALPTWPSDEDFVLGEIGESSDQLSESESDS